MPQQSRIVNDEDDSISLLTTLLIRYPQVCTVNYIPAGRLLKLGFILKEDLEKKEYNEFNNEFVSCIETFLYFENRTEAKNIKLRWDHGPGITILEITRDAATLTQRELALIIDLLRERFDQLLVSDGINHQDEALLEQDDLIRYMLDKIKQRSPKSKLIAVREEGRVLVFKR